MEKDEKTTRGNRKSERNQNVKQEKKLEKERLEEWDLVKGEMKRAPDYVAVIKDKGTLKIEEEIQKSNETKNAVLSTFAADTSGELDDDDAFAVDRAHVGVFEKADRVSLAGLLERHHDRTLETKDGREFLGDLSDQPMEKQVGYQQFGALLIAMDLSERYGTGPVTIGLSHAAGGERTPSGRFLRQLFARRLASGSFTSDPLSSC
ncbi:hypothetical protein FQR65_LT04738 [Abscondita terminalis]|nr:hypothetical protein FQR65_LT04738 [Abscondita terminalis]